MARKALVVSVIAAATVALLLAAVALHQSSVSAQPIAGATYIGAVSGGGTVESTVSAARSSPTPTPTLTPDQMHNCPESGKWSIATWSGQDAMPIADALAFCPQQVDVAYRIDPHTQAWTRYFRGRPEISNLATLDNGHGIIALGAGVSAASTAGDEPLRAMASGMLGCPQPGKWAIAVWDGDDGTDASEAFATCGEGAVTVAYSIDPDTQLWSRWFAGRPEISNLTALNDMQGVMALGGTQAPAPAAGPLKIGVLVPYTGILSDFGEPFANAAKLAVKEINEAGGVLGQDVVLVEGDSGTEPVQAMEEARRLIDIEEVSAIIGAAASGVTLPVAESVTVPSEIVQISPSSTLPALTTVDDNDYLFRTTIQDIAQGGVLAHLADDLGFTSACTMYVNDAYGQGISELFADTFEGLGGTVTAQVSHAAEEQVSYLSELNQCVEGDPDVLAAISYPNHGVVYLEEAVQAALIDTFLFVDGTMSPHMFEELGWDNFEGMYGTAPGALESAAGTAFTAAYEAEYGEKPTVPFMRETYDAVYVIALAAEKAGSTDSTAIRNVLRDIANPPGEVVNPGVEGFETALTLIAAGTAIDYQGAAGPIDFDSNGDVPQGVIEIWQVSGSAIVEAVRTFAVDLSTTPPTVTEVTE